MKRTLVVILSAFVIAIAAFSCEWRYSDDMQQHISLVNGNLESAKLDATYSSDLIGSLQAMTAVTDVAGEIIDTHEHVHTLKDEVLAWKIKRAVEQSATVGDAIQIVVAKWPKSI